jgi:hypothetical protein
LQFKQEASQHPHFEFSQTTCNLLPMRFSVAQIIANTWQDPRKLRRALGITVGILAVGVNVGVIGTLALDWQHLYQPEEFHTWGDVGRFYTDLQTGIPPFWAFWELCSQLLLGTTKPFTLGLYPLVIGLNAYLGTTLFAHTRWQVVVGAALSLLFAFVMRFIHKGNPQLYDVLTPALLMAWLAVLQRLRATNRPQRYFLRLSLLAGLLLSVLELTRTLIFPVMPFLLFFSFLAFRPLPIKYFLFFLIPIVVLSGSWHLKQYAMHGHIHWTNHDGYNLYNSWGIFAEPIPATCKDDPPRYVGGFDNINTDKHSAYNLIVRQLVMDAIKADPKRTFTHCIHRFLEFFGPKTDLFSAHTPKAVNIFYRPAVWFCGLSMLLGLALLTWKTLRSIRTRSAWLIWGRPESILLFMTFVISCVFAFGERGEDARFMVSILPQLAAVAVAVLGFWGKDGFVSHSTDRIV